VQNQLISYAHCLSGFRYQCLFSVLLYHRSGRLSWLALHTGPCLK